MQSEEEVFDARNIDTSVPLILAIMGFLCCWPLGIWSLITVMQVKNARSQAEASVLLLRAKQINIANIIIGAIVFVISLVLGFIGALAG